MNKKTLKQRQVTEYGIISFWVQRRDFREQDRLFLPVRIKYKMVYCQILKKYERSQARSPTSQPAISHRLICSIYRTRQLIAQRMLFFSWKRIRSEFDFEMFPLTHWRLPYPHGGSTSAATSPCSSILRFLTTCVHCCNIHKCWGGSFCVPDLDDDSSYIRGTVCFLF